MSDARAPEGDDYSATVLGSHWFSGPPGGEADEPATRRAAEPGATRRLDAAPAPDSDPDTRRLDEPDTKRFDTPQTTPGAVPDRIEGSVLRFGPGVTAAVPAPFPVVVGTAVGNPRRRGGQWRRYTLAAVVLAAVLAYLGWQRFGPAVEVRDVAVSTDPKGPSCDSAADVVALVRTNGRPGTLAYRWLRSDGTRSEQLTERVPSGRREVALHLLWTFHGAGTYPARAEIELVSPSRHTASVEFTYRCRS
ncbi:hypothetical protein ABT144_09210 [Streptomyces sp. NPDC002039]|uniref:hypothetical protein n=1 Tax=Streptomyces sp. NPDC002039 TaxID=3154660 RepID=UPI0033283AC4